MADNQQTAKTPQEIAAMLIQSPTKGTSAVEDADTDQVGETETEEESEVESPTEGSESEENDNVSEDDEIDAEDEGEDEADEEEADEDEEVEVVEVTYNDDDVIEVMIDGQLETRTLAELKKAAAGEGAIEKRLTEATEIRKTAHAERTTMLEKLYAQEAIVTNVLSALDDSMFVALIPKPNDALKQSNPALYLKQMEAYEFDQKRIKTAKEAIGGTIQKLQKQREERLAEYGEKAAAIIAKEIPDLVSKDKVVAARTFERMVETAKSFGYTEQEINTALDPRMFKLVHTAMLFNDMKSKNREVVKDVKAMATGKKTIRKLKAGTTKAKAVASASAKQLKEAKDRAKATGAVKDVAALLVTKPPKR